jgi:murein DD-endopeptidase MepM/ murein hydrolase activator NlpD
MTTPNGEYSILLLPKTDYWTWVDAAKDYVAKFGANLTADPASAASYMAPRQIVTVGGLAGAYAAQGDIQSWFRTRHPRVRLDYVPCQSADEFHALLKLRLEANQRYLSPGALRLRWPTDFGILNQGFGEHPEVYRRWGLPGNDGLDIFAPHGTKIYAAADGTVTAVENYHGDPAAMPDGNAVVIEHAGGYSTRYTHLGKALVSVGERLKAGQALGLAGASGSAGSEQLHLVLMQAGATTARLTPYPGDIIDPTPFMEWPSQTSSAATLASYRWPPGYCLVGLHGRANGPMQDADYPPVAQARVEAVKLLSSAQPGDVDKLRALNPRLFLLVRMFAAFDGRHVSSADFASWMAGDLAPFYSRGLRYFEVHNEPNLVMEGWTQSWNDGRAFGAWFVDVVNRLRPHFPEARFGFPGLSPGDSIPGLRMAALDFLSGADGACRAADWIGIHCYWLSEEEMNSPAGGLGFAEYRSRFPGKLLFVTEFSNPGTGTDKQTKGKQYERYYQMLRTLPGLGAAFSFVVSASTGFGTETWRSENGSPTEIPALVGARSDNISGTPPPPR